jgi:ketosteroid isomerase-like protein
MQGSGSGSGMGSGSAAATKPMTADDMSKRFEQCWGFFNDAKWDDFTGCYANDASYEMPGGPGPGLVGAKAIVEDVKMFKTTFPDLKGENQLELINGHTIVAVTLVTGTMTGDMKTPMGDLPATKNKIGLFTTQVMDVNDQGQATHEAEYVDMATMMGQMKPDPKHAVRAVMDKLPMAKEVVIAKDDQKEKDNLATTQKVMDAFSKHDAKAFGALLADDVTWSEQFMPKDTNKKETIANAEGFWKAFPDVKLTADKQYPAGDYVATVGTLEGTNTGDDAAMHLKKTGKSVKLPYLMIQKLDGGKVKASWLFDQSMEFAKQLGMMPPPAAKPAAPAKK